MTYEELKYLKTLKGSEQLSRDEQEMLMDLDDELYRSGNFVRVYPVPG